MQEGSGGGGAITTIGFLIPLIVLLPAALARRRRTLNGLRQLRIAGFWLALGIALYTEGLLRGQIARVTVLFYLTPIWGTLLSRIFLRQPITGRRLATIVLGFAGMLVIFGTDLRPSRVATADWMGLAAGFSWAVAMVALNRGPAVPLFERVFVHFVFLAPVFFLVALIPGDASHANVTFHLDVRSLPWLLTFSLLWMLPVIALTVFGASHMDPGRFAILLMFEIVVALASATLLTDEPVGVRELAGAALVMGAIGVEIGAVRSLSL